MILYKVYLKKEEGDESFKITIAKKGEFKNFNNTQILVLHNGQTINSVNNKITNLS